MPDGSNIGLADFAPPPAITPNPDYVPAYIEKPARWLYDLDQGNGVSRATYIGEVFIGGQAAGNQAATKADIAAATTGVSTFNTRSGAVVLLAADVTGVGGALLASPTFTGTPAVPTAAPGSNTTQAASTAFVTAAIGAVTAATVASFNGRVGAVSLSASDITTAGGALTASPAFTGSPTGPTAAVGNASGQLATTQFVSNAIAGAVVSWNGRTGNVALQWSDVASVGGAPINSPTFTGTPAVPTAAPGTATTQAASTAFVTNAITGATTGVASFNTRTGAVTLQTADVVNVGGALLASPTFTGTPSGPTATAGTSTTQFATTAFVANAVAGLPGVTSFNSRTGPVTLQAADVTGVGGALLASPTFTGTPAGPTPTAGDSSTKLATTAFVAGALPVASTTTPNMDGTAAVGTGTTWARADHVHPSDTSRLTQAQTDARYLPLTGGTISNGGNDPLTISAPSASVARIFYDRTGTGARNWSLGQLNNGNFALADETAGAQVMNVTAGGGLVSFTCPISVASSGIVYSTYGTQNIALRQTQGTFEFDAIVNAASFPLIYSGSPGGNLAAIYSFYVNGSTGQGVCYYGPSSTISWSITFSDRRLKRNIQRTKFDALAAINALTVYSCDFHSPLPGAVAEYWNCAVLADEVGDILPEAYAAPLDEHNFASVKELPLIATLVRAVQQLTERVAALEHAARRHPQQRA